eukprot:scaffold6159_cov207-Cylindrotheca_fusiformis.AAC.2
MGTHTDDTLDMNQAEKSASTILPPAGTDTSTRPDYILALIVTSQFGDLVAKWDNLKESSVAFLNSSVKLLGFILGTLVFALLSIAYRYSPTKVFMLCSPAGAACNAVLPACGRTETLGGLVFLRLATGFFLAGICRPDVAQTLFAAEVIKWPANAENGMTADQT